MLAVGEVADSLNGHYAVTNISEQAKDNKLMGAKTPAPRNPNALAGKRLRGTVPSSHRGIGTPKSSQSPIQIQGWGTDRASAP